MVAVDAIPLPQERSNPLLPADAYQEINGRPVRVRIRDGSTPWMFSKYEEVRHILNDMETFSVDNHSPYHPHLSKTSSTGFITLPFLDIPDHPRVRKSVQREFTHHRIKSHRDKIEHRVHQLLDVMEEHGPPFDFLNGFAIPFPVGVLCDLFGLPESEQREFVGNASTILLPDATREQAAHGMTSVVQYVESFVSSPCRPPGLVDRVVQHVTDTGCISHSELQGLIRTVLFAGHETTTRALGLGVLALFQNRDQLPQLMADPANAVEEILRHQTIFHLGMGLFAKESTELGGIRLDPGDGVVASFVGANHDKEVFPHPHRLHLARENASKSVALGHGPHECLGGNLAHLELQIAFASLFERFPNLRLAVDQSRLTFQDSGILYGVAGRMPVTW
ncbi:cytochrome P450 [Streptomyces sp. NPDC087440]|uniref:cytochrome P450 n=1 Tax=Streptomyces sp. NPDC087440 TaxID=3365790 RepID=UPI0037FEF715